MEINNTYGQWVNTWRQGVSKNIPKEVKTAIPQMSFAAQVQGAEESSDASGVESYRKYLEKKYGNVTIESVGKDRESLEKMGKSMRGNDVVIAPNILEQMAKNPQKAAYYERKIDFFFADIPRQTALCAAKGLDYQPCGVVIHEDGSVTYISGCADSPERVAKVNAINRAKREKQAALRKAGLERSLEEAQRRKTETETKESKTESDIVVKPDGSRVLVITMNVGGMETTMSLEISKPTDMINDRQNEISTDNMEQNLNLLEKNMTN
ncbi:MAG: DUF6033 family protein [Alistipes sp.]|nr:DUF6033 family protein [Alistipes sp.]